jgi:GT2 family glycosyltransferase/glycosyltransferase involved in cell wall biosynthesis
LLHPACVQKPAWAVFDRGWYLHHYADARAMCADKPPEAALLYYLRVGARLGHSPSPLFDEIFYLDRNPDVTELVRAGRYASGFDHYCQHGHRALSPHWLFDDALYAGLYEDMTLEVLDAHGCYGRYDHFLRSGQRERRMGHYLFDGPYYREQVGEEADGPGPYTHFLSRLGSGADELAPSPYFDPAWYVEHHPGAKADLARGKYVAAIHHYLTNPAPEGFDPVPQFSESFYRRRYPDIAAAVEAGLYRNAYQQFVQYGCFELRQPSPDIDLAYYRDANERVRNDLNAGVVRDAFAHLRVVGLAAGLAYAPPNALPSLDEAATREAFLRQARAQLALFARQRLDFACEAPEVSVIVVVFNKFELTMRALASLRQNFAGGIELIVVDNGSTDGTRRLGDYVAGAKILRMDENLGYLRAANRGLAEVSAPALLYLNNDIELGYGAVAAALRRLASAEMIGAVGAKIIRTNGRLQEAGSIICADGTTLGYMRDASPLAPEANFVRDVDYCSAVFLLARTALVRELGGFDEAFAPAYYEDADLCVRMTQAGYRVVYDPAVSLTHMEFGSAATSEASMALMRRGRRLFRQKHAGWLKGQVKPGAANHIRARRRSGARIVLFIEDTVPLRRLGSGFGRSHDVVRAIVAAGWEVHVFPINGAPYDVMSLYGDLPEGVEVLAGRDFVGLPAFLAERKGVYDLVWVARTHNLGRVLPLLRKAERKAPIVLDTEAVASLRAGSGLDLKTEFAVAGAARDILAVSEAEAALLRGLGFDNVQVLGTPRVPQPLPAPFAAREGLLFVGAIHQADAPNLDSLDWYVREILPALAQEFGGAPPVLHVAGHVAAGLDISRFAGPFVHLHGEVSDLRALYGAARVFIAPTRFAAGTPYKIYEAVSYGLPCVVTPLLAEQLGWDLPRAADAAGFAREVARLYQNEALWTAQRGAALARLGAENRPEDFNATVARVLG